MTIPVGNINYNMDYSAEGTPPDPQDDMAHGSLGFYRGGGVIHNAIFRLGCVAKELTGLSRGEWLVSKTDVLGTVRK